MYQVRKKNGLITKDYREILNEQVDFYVDLYQENKAVCFDLDNIYNVGLSESQRVLMDLDISDVEISQALNEIKKQKSPGSDGIPIEFYCTFQNELKDILLEVFNYSYECRQLPLSMRRGLLTLIPKKNKDPIEIKNNRPLTMLNVDYKNYARILAARMENVIQDLIGAQQTGFMKGRSIEENLVKTMEVIAIAKRARQNKKYVIMTIDNKCFHRINHNAIERVFRFFRFGDRFIRHLMLLYTNFELCTQNNGFTSQYFSKKQGINQGCNASPLVYILCGEILALLIKHNPNIKGVSINDVIEILSQFADDTSLFLEYDMLTIETTTQILSQMEKYLGLQISYEKTTIYRIGSLVNSNAKMYTSKEYAWSDGPIDTLGIKLGCTGEKVKSNFEDILLRVDNVCNDWGNRTLTLVGKVLVVNTLISSLFVYKMSVMMNLSVAEIQVVETKIRKFIWGGKKDKIPIKILQLCHKDGGLKLVNLRHKQNALKIKWIFKLNDSVFLRQCAYTSLDQVLQENIWRCNLHAEDIPGLFGTDTFWAQVITAWAELNHHMPDSKTEVLHEILWFNSHIRINDSPIVLYNYIQAGIIKITDIWEEVQNRFLTHEELCRHYNVSVNWLEYRGLISSIPKSWITILLAEVGDNEATPPTDIYEELCGAKQIPRTVYDLLISDCDSVIKYREAWSRIGVELEEEEYKTLFREIRLCTKDPKLQSFQYRLLLNKVFLNDKLYRWGKSPTELCYYCNDEVETVTHFFYTCNKAKKIWERIENALPPEVKACTKFDVKNVLLNRVHENPRSIVNYVVLLVKQLIFAQRCLKADLNEQLVMYKIDEQYRITKYNVKYNGLSIKKEKRWKEIITNGSFL